MKLALFSMLLLIQGLPDVERTPDKTRAIKDELMRVGYFMEGTASVFSSGIITKKIKGLDNYKTRKWSAH